MNKAENFIDFVLRQGDEDIRVKTWSREHEDLRLLIKEYLNADDFGQCGGMGRCATCMVTISSNFKHAPDLSNRFPNLRITGGADCIVKLSCQVIINDDLANKTISILPSRAG